MKPGQSKRISAQKVILTSFLVDVSDVVINVAIALISGSVVMLSQALEGAADLLASGLLVWGIRRSKLPADKTHPYGHGQEIYFWTFLSALATFTITAGASFYLGLKRFLHPEPIQNLTLAYLGLAIAIATNGYAMSLSYKRLLKKRPLAKFWKIFIHSPYIETKATFVLDLMGTLASFLGLIALAFYQFTQDLRFDGLGAMAIGMTLAFLAFFIIKGAKDLLVGQSARPEIEEKIIQITKSFPEVNSIIDLRTLQIGPEQLLVSLDVHLIQQLTTKKIENLIDKIEGKIKEEVPSAVDIQIELENPNS